MHTRNSSAHYPSSSRFTGNPDKGAFVQRCHVLRVGSSGFHGTESRGGRYFRGAQQEAEIQCKRSLERSLAKPGENGSWLRVGNAPIFPRRDQVRRRHCRNWKYLESKANKELAPWTLQHPPVAIDVVASRTRSRHKNRCFKARYLRPASASTSVQGN